MVELKNIQGKKCLLGQFFTPLSVCEAIVSSIRPQESDLFVEPSFGSGNFLRALSRLPNPLVGVELDADLFAQVRTTFPAALVRHENFYDFSVKWPGRLIFVGNPPYRTPAPSLHSHKALLVALEKKYGVCGIREEAVFFLLRTIDLILENGHGGEIHYILPQTILKNNSKFYTGLKHFLLRTCRFLTIRSIRGMVFDGVAQDLICLSLEVEPTQEAFLGELFAQGQPPPPPQKQVPVDGTPTDLMAYLRLSAQDEIPFQRIFKKTYLGSVPCESLLLSVHGEPLQHFRQRLCEIVATQALDKDKLYNLLQYQGRFHLKVFSKPRHDKEVRKKLGIVLDYVRNIQARDNILAAFQDLSHYKEITVRGGETRFYFRYPALRKGANFVYELNPNPCPSFYFTGNPSHSSTDYFGFCSYDINRNVSPGANRTVPVKDIVDNLTDEFKNWWRANTDAPFCAVFDYLIGITKTPWYKAKKRENKRFYFSIPADFDPQIARTLQDWPIGATQFYPSAQ